MCERRRKEPAAFTSHRYRPGGGDRWRAERQKLLQMRLNGIAGPRHVQSPKGCNFEWKETEKVHNAAFVFNIVLNAIGDGIKGGNYFK